MKIKLSYAFMKKAHRSELQAMMAKYRKKHTWWRPPATYRWEAICSQNRGGKLVVNLAMMGAKTWQSTRLSYVPKYIREAWNAQI